MICWPTLIDSLVVHASVEGQDVGQGPESTTLAGWLILATLLTPSRSDLLRIEGRTNHFLKRGLLFAVGIVEVAQEQRVVLDHGNLALGAHVDLFLLHAKESIEHGFAALLVRLRFLVLAIGLRHMSRDLVKNEPTPTLDQSGHVGLPHRVLVGEDESQGRGLWNGPHGPEKVARVAWHPWIDIHPNQRQ